jgi:hypothetical protein
VNFGGQYLRNLATNVSLFLARDLHMKSGMKFLIESFYRSIVESTPPPIPSREILLIAKIMDDIFAQLNRAQGENSCPGTMADAASTHACRS